MFGEKCISSQLDRKVIRMYTLNADVYNVLIHYLRLKVPRGDLLFHMVMFKCLSVAELFADSVLFCSVLFLVAII